MFAIVLRERMAELASSIFFVKPSISSPFLRFWFLSCSISEAEVLKSIASRSEQKAEMQRVKNVVTSNMSIL